MRLAFVLTLAFVLVGCSGSGGDGVVPDDFHLVLGEGGGVTGQWTGITVLADGTLKKWQGKAAEENAEKVGTLDKAEMTALWKAVDDAHIFSLRGEKPQNFSRIIMLTAGEKSNEVRWTPRLGSGPTAIDTFYKTCRDLAQKHSES
ncbi:MAG: hypothetical protein HKN21_00635 [Candidatus Eisenbacteria bacterium]|uniref:Uncharacterized protein n=1 Tax=Eiseniibacteriota bacterium TaxID=2212470 RepID=A0A7Y2H0Q3_UNCEI|nr:hypothetical protein [Candidatus Eisenbacteria bacterium]